MQKRICFFYTFSEKQDELKHIIPNIHKIFGTLEYTDEGNVEQERIDSLRGQKVSDFL